MLLRVIELDLYPILDQLKLEEALLRTNTHNWCLINRGSPPAVVMGISQDLAQVVDQNAHTSRPIPLIRRYSGGGTVVVEPATVLVTLILNHDQINTLPFPKEVLKWTEELYLPAFGTLPFALKENDYAIGDKKCGGNAQYFAKGRFVHHTSFLWDYTPEHMSLLQMPPKMPAYREGRTHQDFLAPLKPFFATQKEFSEAILKAISLKFPMQQLSLPQVEPHLFQDHRKSSFEFT
jgi:lipoate-protein ligase A